MRDHFSKKAVRAAILSFFAIIILYPILIVAISSFRTNSQIMMNLFGLPEKLMFENYETVWTKSDIPVYLKNSIINTGFSVCTILMAASLVAFVTTRKDCWFRQPLYLLFTLGSAIPMQVGIISQYLMMTKIKLLNSHVGLILIYTAYGLPMAVFIMHNFFRAIPLKFKSPLSSTDVQIFNCFYESYCLCLSPC